MPETKQTSAGSNGIQSSASEKAQPKKLEPNNGLTFQSKEFLAYYIDGKLVAIEDENGHVERYLTEPSSKHKWKVLLGLDKAQYASGISGGGGRPV